MESNPRYLSYLILRRVFKEGAYADKALFNILKQSKLEERDRAFVKELTFGSIKRRQLLDYLIARNLNRPLEDLDSDLINILRLGAYQICFLRVPDYAAVNEMVDLTKSVVGKGTDKLANAVLRKIASQKCSVQTGDEIEEISLVESHPRWIVELWSDRFGLEETRRICSFDNEAQPITIRVNFLKKSREELLFELNEMNVKSSAGSLEESITVSSGLDLSSIEPYKKGEFIVQSESSILVGRSFDGFEGDYLIDLCAAPGGKSTHLSQMLGGQGKVVAVEVNRARAKLIEKNAKRMGLQNIELKVGDARNISLEAADGVLLDVPCTGLGVLGRRPELRWRVGPEDIARMAELQSELLDSAAEMVRPGGLLVYSTCTISAAENEEQAASFLESHTDFELEKLPAVFARFSVDMEKGYIQLIPPRDKMDGFFIARMRRREAVGHV